MNQSPHHQIAQSPDVAARCPRCGYDQRGPVTTWTQQCPLTGTCAECGLNFDWGELLHPEKFEPRWCVEFVLVLSRFPEAAVRTFVLSFLARRFWSSLRMAFPVRRHRLQAYIVSLILPLFLSHAILQTAMTLRVRAQFKTQAAALLAPPPPPVSQTIAHLRAQVLAYRNTPYNSGYGMSQEEWKEWNDATIESMESEIASLSAQAQAPPPPPPPVPNIPLIPELIKAIVIPFSDTWGPSVILPGGPLQYPSPAGMWWFIRPQILGPFAGQWFFLWSVGSVLWSPILFVPAGFILLPISRKRANVRWAHVGRVMAYSAFIPVALWCFAMLATALALALGGGWIGSANTVATLPLFALPIWVTLWWAVAIRRYLLMPHGWVVSILLSVLSILFCTAVYTYITHRISPREIWVYTKMIFE